MFSRHVFRTSSRHFFKTSSRHVFKTSWRPTNVCWVLSSKLISPNGKVTSFGDQFLGLSSKNCGPWNQCSKSQWAKDMERVEISAGFDEDRIWNQMSGDEFARMTFTLFCTQIFQRFSTCFIHHKATMLSFQQNMDDTVTTWLMTSSTDTYN